MNIRSELFSDAMAAEFKDKRVLFISDIRLEATPPGVTDLFRSCNTEDEWTHAAGCIASDLSMQERWVRDMSPVVALVVRCSSSYFQAAMLKFRFPFDPAVESMTYLDGRLFLPVWGGRHSTETRLIVTEPV